MSIDKSKLVGILATKVPVEIVEPMLDEYIRIKQQFFLRKYQPSELNGARFGECVLRALENLHRGGYTPFGQHLSTDTIIRGIEGNTTLPDTLRIFIPRLVRVILDVRNKRNVAHVGGEVNPNYSDSLLIIQSTDWILTEFIRHFHSCSVDEATEIVCDLNVKRIPIITEVDGFVRVQNTSLDTKKKVLAILYYKYPSKVVDKDLCKWVKYTNLSRFRSQLLADLDNDALIHYESSNCVLLDKGILFVEKNIPMDVLQ